MYKVFIDDAFSLPSDANYSYGNKKENCPNETILNQKTTIYSFLKITFNVWSSVFSPF